MTTKIQTIADTSKLETEEIDLDMTCHEESPPSKIHPSSTRSREMEKNCDHKEPSKSPNGSKRSIILGELEDELERQLEEKAKRNELSANNVKSLLRAVLTQEDVSKYVESTVAKSDELPEYQLKLTRAKAKELIDRIPKIAPLLCLPTPQKKSDIDVLIREELPEDSSDEEYQPLDDTVDDDDDSVLAGNDANIMSSAMSTPAPEPPITGPDENIAERTRSKLSLSETPLETIEQAFIPPDITEDMYNTECDNQDWLNFLKDLVQPLDTTAGQEAHDDENDPEYNIQPDELEAPDNEELRADPAVKISKKEINSLIDELFEYTKMHEDGFPSDEERTMDFKDEDMNSLTAELQHSIPETNGQTPESLNPLPNSQENLLQSEQQFTPEPPKPAPVVESVKIPSMVCEEQYLLIKQQLAQHVQLLLQTYLLSCGSPFVSEKIREAGKSCLLELKTRKDLVNVAESAFSLSTLDRSLELLSIYETLVNKNLQAMLKWNREKASHNAYVRTRWAGSAPIHPILMKLCLQSKAFQYPLLLPEIGFRDPNKSKVSPKFFPPQEYLISSGLHDCVLNLGMEINDNDQLQKCCDLIHDALLPDRTPKQIFTNVKRKSRGPDANPIRKYYVYKVCPAVEHFVVPLDDDKLLPLYLQDIKLFHFNWHKALYEERASQKALLARKKRKLSEEAVELDDKRGIIHTEERSTR